MEDYARVTLYTPNNVGEKYEGDIEDILETAYIEYDKELGEDLARPKLEINRTNDTEIYIGIDEIKNALKETDLEDIERRF